MTLAGFQISAALWPYLVVLLVGVAPTIVWRMLGLVLAKGIREDSEFLHWVRLVASALLVAVVAKLLLVPSGMLGTVPVWGRIGALAAGLASLFVFRRSILAAVAIGEAVLLASAMLK